MKVVITGATGNIGTALLGKLGADGPWRVTGLARRLPALDHQPYRCADWTPCELGDPGARDTLAVALQGADAVVHLAWAIHPRRDDPPMRRTNVSGTRQLLQAAARAGVPHVVVASSVAAYLPPPRWSRVSEDWPCGGIAGSAYSRGKAWLEAMLDDFAAEQPAISLARVRPCAVVQREAAGQFSRWLLSALLPEAALGRPWLIAPLWQQLRAQLVHADDVAAAVHAILVRRASGAFNLAADPVLTAAELAEALRWPRFPAPRAALAPLAWLSWRGGLQPVHPGWLALADRAALVSCARAETELDWQPAHDTRSALAELVTGIRTRAGAASAPLAPQPPWDVQSRLRTVPWGRPSHQSQS